MATIALISQKSFASLGAYGDKLVLGAILVVALCYSARGRAAL
jgi:branched-chain amino acid transport system permease protein